MMLEQDCGEIPVIENVNDLKPIGVITDRDIVCRAIAIGKDPLGTTVSECMSRPCITVTPETTVEDCCRKLKENHIRRILVIDEQGRCCGIVSKQALRPIDSRMKFVNYRKKFLRGASGYIHVKKPL